MQNIKVCDVSLSEIFKSNINVSFKEKLEIAKKLDELELDAIEVGPIGDNKADEVLLKTIATCITKSTIGVVCDCNEKNIEKNYSLISNAKKKKIVIKLPVSSVKMEYAFGIKPQNVMQLLKNCVEKAISFCENVEVSFDDATRAEKDFLINAISIVLGCGVKTITISDSDGSFDSNEFKTFTDSLINKIPNLKGINLFVECSNDFNMAMGNILTSFNCGANGVKLSALNNGNLLNFESFFKTMDNVAIKKGFDTKINKTCLNRVVGQIASIFYSQSKPVEVISQNVEVKNVSKTITISELNKLLKKRGYDLAEEDITKVLEEIKRIGEKKEINTKDLDSIVAATALQVPSTYTLISYAVHCSNVVSSTANVTLKNKDKEINGIAIGNGSVDSAFLALENALGRHFDLDEFVVNAVTEGKEAMGETIIKLRNNGKIYSGRGISTDIVGASIRAYINAVNKIVYEEKE